MDFIGVTRTIDQAVYMLLNSLAIVLWRIDSAIIGMSLYSYATQDWLTGNGGGVWYIMDWLLDTSGLFGINTWTLFAGLALMLWGLSRIARPFIPSAPVHPGKLLVFFVLSYVVISQGSTLMQDIESWRLDAGSAVYQSVASSSSPSINVPSVPSTSDPLAPPADLDGQSPIRGWEAVAASYFLAANADDLHQPYPPEAFRVAYCLYNPEQPIETQTTENAQGCSPRNAWDEWDIGDLSILEDVLGIDVDGAEDALEDFLEVLLGDIDLELTSPVPVTVHHPENRELGIRQAQAGVARLALGAIVALFPMVEANISLMLALAASFIYLTLPIVLLFGFFLATEPMVNRLLMQFVNVIIRTLVINGIVALFMLLLMNTALSGSLTAYLGLVGVGLIGGFFLARVAASTMKETLSQAMGALGAIWMGSTTGLLGKSAAQPAKATLGLAKMGAAAALMGAGGAMSFLDLAETGYEGFRAGAKDLRQGAPGTMNYVDRQAARLPTSLAPFAQAGLGSEGADGPGTEGDGPQTDSLTTLATAMAAPLAVGALAASSRSGSTRNDRAGGGSAQGSQPDRNGPSKRWDAAAGVSSPALAQTLTANNGHHLRQRRQAEVDRWVGQMYRARQAGRGQKQAGEKGRDLLGEELAWKAERAIGRHTPAEVQAVLDTARQVAGERERADLVRNGRLTGAALSAVRDKLDLETANAFEGQKGAWDMAALTAVALQQQAAASPEEFRRAMARAGSGWGQDSPGHKVPRTLGLDPVAAGAHYTAMNRFSRLSEEAGLTTAQRERLLAEAQTGQISADLRQEIETSLQKQRKLGQGMGLTTEALIAGALAMPLMIAGPEQVWTTPEKSGQSSKQSDTGEQERQSPNQAGASKARQPANGPAARAKAKQVGITMTGGTVGQQPIVQGQKSLGYALKSSLRDQTPEQATTQPGRVTAGAEKQRRAEGQAKPKREQARPAPKGEPTTRPPGQPAGSQPGRSNIAAGHTVPLTMRGAATKPQPAGQRKPATGPGQELKSSEQGQTPDKAEAKRDQAAGATRTKQPATTQARPKDKPSGSGPRQGTASLPASQPAPPDSAKPTSSQAPAAPTTTPVARPPAHEPIPTATRAPATFPPTSQATTPPAGENAPDAASQVAPKSNQRTNRNRSEEQETKNDL